MSLFTPPEEGLARAILDQALSEHSLTFEPKHGLLKRVTDFYQEGVGTVFTFRGIVRPKTGKSILLDLDPQVVIRSTFLGRFKGEVCGIFPNNRILLFSYNLKKKECALRTP